MTARSHPEVSNTTQKLIDLLVARDRAGRAKYGTTLDRTDLAFNDWLQHMAEELLDGAGYALAAKRTNALAAPGIDLEPFRLLVEGCEAEFTGAETEELEPDESKVSYPEDRCHITFGMIRNARKALDASPKGGRDAASELRIWGIQKPGSMPKLFGVRHIAELNWYPDEGHDLVCMQVVERVQSTSAEVGVCDGD